jgi:HTH-type transcriptional regulator / antitoxin HipB
MTDFPVRTPEQLIPIFAAFRKRSGLSQAELAHRIGVGQQTVSQLERNPDKASVERLMRALAELDVELILRVKGTAPDTAIPTSVNKVDW